MSGCCKDTSRTFKGLSATLGIHTSTAVFANIDPGLKLGERKAERNVSEASKILSSPQIIHLHERGDISAWQKANKLVIYLAIDNFLIAILYRRHFK